MLASPTLQAVRVLLWQTGRAVPEEQLLRVWRELCAETPAPAAVDFLAALRAQELLSGTLLDCEQVRLLASTTVAPPPGDPALAETTVAPPPGDPALAETTVAPPPGPDTETATQVAPSGADVPDTSGLAEGSSGGWSYELVEAIGQGGMGTVYLALDRNLLRQTAVKRLRDERQPAARARFVYEAQVMSQLDHPNVLPAYALRLEDDGTPSVALKLVRGRTLQDLIGEHQRWGPTRAREHLAERLEVLIKVCEGVGYAHARGVIHRDLKPANVMLGDHGEVYVVDWGLCKLREQTELPHVDAAAPQSSAALDQTLRGQLKGTPLYFSPEQAAGDPEAIGPASDQYALGLILYELLALRFAYEPTSLPALVEQAQTARLRPVPAELGVHPDARAIVAKATALRPEERYASVLEFAADLRRFLRQEATLARPDTPARAARRWLGRHAGGVVAALGLALVALVALSVIRSATAAAAEQAAANQRQAARLRLDARAARLSHHFLGYARELEGLASAAEQALIAGEPWQGALYTRARLADPATAPPDLTTSPDYRAPISPSWPLCEGPAGADPARLEAQARRLLAVRPRLLDVFRCVSEGAPRQGPLRPGDAVEWAYVVLESTGLIVLLPGSAGAGWEEGFDIRSLPTYRDAVAAARAGSALSWSDPYLDLLGQGRLITCNRALFDAEGGLLGVGSLDLSLDAVVRRDLGPGEGVRRASLLDAAGRVVAETGDADADAPGESGQELELRPYAHAAVVDGVRGGASTGLVTAPDGSLVAWQRLAPLPWTLAIEVAPD